MEEWDCEVIYVGKPIWICFLAGDFIVLCARFFKKRLLCVYCYNIDKYDWKEDECEWIEIDVIENSFATEENLPTTFFVNLWIENENTYIILLLTFIN